MLFCKLWEVVLSLAWLIKLSYISVCNRDNYAHVSSASVSNVCISIFKVIVFQNVHLEIAMRKLFNTDYGKKKKRKKKKKKKKRKTALGKLRKCGRKLLSKLRKYDRKWLDQLANFSFSSLDCLYANR